MNGNRHRPPTIALQLKFCNYETVRGNTIVAWHFLFPTWPHSWPSPQCRGPPARGCNILYRCISTAEAVFKRFLPLWATLPAHYKDQAFSITGLRCSGLSIHGPGHSSTRLTLQLTGGSSSKQSRATHISPAFPNTTHIHVNLCAIACTAKSRRADISYSRNSEDIWVE